MKSTPPLAIRSWRRFVAIAGLLIVALVAMIGCSSDSNDEPTKAAEPTTRVIEFDLHYLDINERRLERMWLDLIFEAPQMNSVRIRDLFLSRHLRADV